MRMSSLMLSALVVCTLIASSSGALDVDLGGAGLSLAAPVPGPVPAPAPAPSSVVGRKLAGHITEGAAGRKLSQLVNSNQQLVNTGSLGLPDNLATGIVDNLPLTVSADASGLPVVTALPQLADVNGEKLGLAGYAPVPAPAPAPVPAPRH